VKAGTVEHVRRKPEMVVSDKLLRERVSE